jgi:hypothetical protein
MVDRRRKNRDASSSQFSAVEHVAGSIGLSRSHEAVPDGKQNQLCRMQARGGALKTLKTSAPWVPVAIKTTAGTRRNLITLKVSLFVSSKARH